MCLEGLDVSTLDHGCHDCWKHVRMEVSGRRKALRTALVDALWPIGEGIDSSRGRNKRIRTLRHHHPRLLGSRGVARALLPPLR